MWHSSRWADKKSQAMRSHQKICTRYRFLIDAWRRDNDKANIKTLHFFVKLRRVEKFLLGRRTGNAHMYSFLYWKCWMQVEQTTLQKCSSSALNALAMQQQPSHLCRTKWLTSHATCVTQGQRDALLLTHIKVQRVFQHRRMYIHFKCVRELFYHPHSRAKNMTI